MSASSLPSCPGPNYLQLHDPNVRAGFQRRTGWICRREGDSIFVDIPGKETIEMYGFAKVDVLESGTIRLQHGKDGTPPSAAKWHIVIDVDGTIRYQPLHSAYLV